jgi:LacI family transcriptional regulator
MRVLLRLLSLSWDNVAHSNWMGPVTAVAGTVTLAHVAEHAGVSLSTASRALNGSTRNVHPELRDRVLQSAAELGYSANAQAQAVAKGTSKTVGVVVGDIADPYFSAIASGVIGVAVKRGLVVTISTADPDPERGITTVQALKGQRPRALIMVGTRRRQPESESRLAAELAAVERLGGRVCLIGSSGRELSGQAPGTQAPSQQPGRGGMPAHGPEAGFADFRTVPIRNREGAGQLADALVDRGYRDFCVLAGDPDLVTPGERTAGFVEHLRRRGIDVPESRIATSAFSRDGAISALRRVLMRGVRPDCIFAVTDVMALGAMTALRELGLRPGADLGVAGFDDIETLQDVTPSLSTVALPLAEIGVRALELALENDRTGPMLATPVDGTVVLRDSTPQR